MNRSRLSERSRDALELRASRGVARGSEEVLRSARHDLDAGYVADRNSAANQPTQPRRTSVFVVVAAFCIGLLVVGGFVAHDRQTDESVTVSGLDRDTATETSSPSPDELAAATDRLEADIASGWVPFAVTPWREGVEVPQDAWVRIDGGLMPPDFDPAEQRIDVYDAKAGTVVGYNYLDLGYVPREVAESPSFDAAAERIARYGCDVRLDEACRTQHVESLVAEIDRLVEAERDGG